jgi:hypothetical protein
MSNVQQMDVLDPRPRDLTSTSMRAGEASIAPAGEESVGAFIRLGEGEMIFMCELQIPAGGRY